MSYLCGICGKNARSSVILCTGMCNKWIHFKCANVTFSDVRRIEKDNLLGKWKCVNCNFDDTTLTDEGNEKANISSLAEEINKSLLNENEDLKQRLHDKNNASGVYMLELEDKLMESEQSMKHNETLWNERENELLIEIGSLRQRLYMEKEAKENLISEVEEDEKLKSGDNYKQTRSCESCTILKDEMKKMLDTIRSLESIISILEKENIAKHEILKKKETEKSICFQCFPPLTSNMQHTSTSNKWQRVSARFSCKPVNVERVDASPIFTSENRFSALSDDECQTSDEPDISISYNYGNSSTKKVQGKYHKRKADVVDASKDKSNKREIKTKSRLLLCADSHGRNLAFHVNKCLPSVDAVGFVRPGGLAEQVLSSRNIEGEKLSTCDTLVILCGSNDTARNEAKSALHIIDQTIKKYIDPKIILIDLPTRHDLEPWSIVNEEIKKTNVTLEALSKNHRNVSLVKASIAERHLHTRHGMHLNNKGKDWLARKICDTLAESDSADTEELSTENSPRSSGTDTKEDGTTAEDINPENQHIADGRLPGNCSPLQLVLPP